MTLMEKLTDMIKPKPEYKPEPIVLKAGSVRVFSDKMDQTAEQSQKERNKGAAAGPGPDAEAG